MPLGNSFDESSEFLLICCNFLQAQTNKHFWGDVIHEQAEGERDKH